MSLQEEMIAAEKRAEPFLHSLRTEKDSALFAKALRGYVLAKYLLPDAVTEEGLYGLAIMSLKYQAVRDGKLPKDALLRMEKYDCHQTDAAVQKKVLLIMRLERLLGCALSDEQAVSCDTLPQLAVVLHTQMYGGERRV